VTPEALARAASSILGSRWQVPLSRLLGVAPRTVRYWASGARPTPRWAWIAIAQEMELRAQEVAQGAAAIYQRLDVERMEAELAPEAERRRYLVTGRRGAPSAA
jgi:hypothetical protein